MRVVTIGMNYTVLPGKGQIFEDACERVVQTMQGIEGHDESHLYRRVDGAELVYLIVSRWQSEDAFGAFIASDAFKKVTRWGKENILSGPPRHTTYREG
jgi:heme-degrading monooxygenase HmoA